MVGWGWNGVGSGWGEHAEAAAIRRSNRRRLSGATIYVAAERFRNGHIVTARPCSECIRKIRRAGIGVVMYRNPNGEWWEFEP